MAVRACPCRYVPNRNGERGRTHVGVKFRSRIIETSVTTGERGHTQHKAQGHAQRERGTSDTPRPEATSARGQKARVFPFPR
eukprot:1378890-Prymnesium_polylepis.2